MANGAKQYRRGEVDGPSIERVISKANFRGLPIVVPNRHVLLTTLYNTGMAPEYHLVYLSDESPRTGTNWVDTTDREYDGLQKWWPVTVGTFTKFTTTHRQFLIYAEERDWTGTWLVGRLENQGRIVRLLAAEGYRRVYEATATEEESGAQ